MTYSINIEILRKAINSLDIAVSKYESKKELEYRDSAIQRFEYTYELATKTLRRVLETTWDSKEQIDKLMFKDMLRFAAEKGLIDDPKVWFEYKESRNETSHAYDENVAKKVYSEAKLFLKDVKILFDRLEATLKGNA